MRLPAKLRADRHLRNQTWPFSKLLCAMSGHQLAVWNRTFSFAPILAVQLGSAQS